MKPKDRMFTQELSPEFMREFGTEAELERAVQRFEDSYNAVAWVTENDSFYGGEVGYTVRAIAAKRADRDEIRRGLQTISHWLTVEE